MIRTPRLRQDEGSEFIRGRKSDSGTFCIRLLRDFVQVPKAASYWVEAQVERWPDGSGARVKVMINEEGSARYWNPKRGKYYPLLWGVLRYLKRLGCKPGKPKFIYFCLWYEK